ncbi:Hypothetical predicted protein [Pelobates cultripes]|uniref:Beta-microseminoprotein n=1 Tax=Pelobates cultripes TaxID=61616 RepID=A0AAD1T8Z7_PELCU|nr:Hypothetical predicted protein [Pelobates cultripes]
MKFILATIFAINILVTQCNAACYTQMNALSPGGEEPKGCLDENGVLHEFNTRWRTKDCLDCSCGTAWISCCSAHGRPVNYDKKKCFVKYDKNACTVEVLQKKDPTKECERYAMVG